MNTYDINHVLSAFSLALDIAENQSLEHAQRSAYIALQIGKQLDLAHPDMQDLYAAALLHDIGITKAYADVHIDPNQLVSHCTHGKQLISTLPFIPARVGEYIAWHHANWDGSGPFQLQGNEIPLGAQIVYLADQLDVKLRSLVSIYSERHLILDYLRASSGKLFNPLIIEAFVEVQRREKFWLDFITNGIAEELAMVPPRTASFSLKHFETVAMTFAQIIDNKSPFTHYHSQGVADLAAVLARYYKFDPDTVRKITISALLHDLGKLAVPNEILDKPGKLTPTEFQIIKGHPYYTKRILSRIQGFDQIRDWAANHHETIDGKGYPEGFSDPHLSIPERIITVCDIYQALTEERPYRLKPISQSKVFEIMDDLVRTNKICPDVTTSLKTLLA